MLGIASLLSMYTIRIPFLSDSSRMFEIPSIFLSFIRSAVFLIMSALLTWYGISLTIIHSLPPTSSKLDLALITIRPRPVWNASFTPS